MYPINSTLEYQLACIQEVCKNTDCGNTSAGTVFKVFPFQRPANSEYFVEKKRERLSARKLNLHCQMKKKQSNRPKCNNLYLLTWILNVVALTS